MSTPVTHDFDGSTINLTLALSPDTIVGQRYLGGGGGPEDGPPEYEPISLLSAIVERTAAILADRAGSDHGVDSRHVTEQVVRAVDAKLTDLLAPILEGILTEPLPASNAYGERTSQTFTLRERIVDIAGKQLTIRPNASSRTHEQNLAERYVGGEIEKAVKKALDAEYSSALAQVREAVANAATEEMKRRITKGLGL